MLTDLFCLIGTQFEASEAKELWPATLGQIQKWAVGSRHDDPMLRDQWGPCEALVRIGCKEFSHLSQRVFTLFPRMEKKDVTTWLGYLCQNVAETLSYNVDLERALHSDISKKINEDINEVIAESTEESFTKDSQEANTQLETLYGKGTLVEKRTDEYDGDSVEISVIKLYSGATLYGCFDNESPHVEIETKATDDTEGNCLITNVLFRYIMTSISYQKMSNHFSIKYGKLFQNSEKRYAEELHSTTSCSLHFHILCPAISF